MPDPHPTKASDQQPEHATTSPPRDNVSTAAPLDAISAAPQHKQPIPAPAKPAQPVPTARLGNRPEPNEAAKNEQPVIAPQALETLRARVASEQDAAENTFKTSPTNGLGKIDPASASSDRPLLDSAPMKTPVLTAPKLPAAPQPTTPAGLPSPPAPLGMAHKTAAPQPDTATEDRTEANARTRAADRQPQRNQRVAAQRTGSNATAVHSQRSPSALTSASIAAPGRSAITNAESNKPVAAAPSTQDSAHNHAVIEGAFEGENAASPDPDLLAALALPSAYELSAQQQAMIPDISFTVHAYSAQPTGRIVRINGRAHREGSTLTDDLRIAEITKHGVVFDLKGARFFMASSETWRTEAVAR